MRKVITWNSELVPLLPVSDAHAAESAGHLDLYSPMFLQTQLAQFHYVVCYSPVCPTY